MQRIELVKCEVDIKRLEGELRARRGENHHIEFSQCLLRETFTPITY
jgi:hypothetical protein